jgi:hypothetical protein
MVVVLGAAGTFAYAEGSFVTNQIKDELTAQQIFFPGADQIKAGGALDPAEFAQEIRDQAGNQVTDGNQARIYANDFIGVHLQKVANGKTYSQVSTEAMALSATLAGTPKTDPNYASMTQQLAALNGQKATLFQGETLRSSLLNAYGWWTIGTYTTYAALGLSLASLVVLGAMVFELLVAGRRTEKIDVARQKTATTATA